MEFFVFGSFVAFWGYAFYNTISHVTTPTTSDSSQQQQQQRRRPTSSEGRGRAARDEPPQAAASRTAARDGSSPAPKGRRSSPRRKVQCHSSPKKRPHHSPVRPKAQHEQSERFAHADQQKRLRSPPQSRSAKLTEPSGASCPPSSLPQLNNAQDETQKKLPPEPVRLSPATSPSSHLLPELSAASASAFMRDDGSVVAKAARMPPQVMVLPANETSLPQVTIPLIAHQSPSDDDLLEDGFTPPPGTAVSSVLCVTPQAETPPALPHRPPQQQRESDDADNCKEQDRLCGDSPPDGPASFGMLQQLTMEETESVSQSQMLDNVSGGAAEALSPAATPSVLNPAANVEEAAASVDGCDDKYSVSSYATLTQSSFVPQTPWSVFLKSSLQQRLRRRRSSLVKWGAKQCAVPQLPSLSSGDELCPQPDSLFTATLRVRRSSSISAHKRPRRQSVTLVFRHGAKRRRRHLRYCKTASSSSTAQGLDKAESSSSPALSHYLGLDPLGIATLDHHFALLSSEADSGSFRDSGSMQGGSARLDTSQVEGTTTLPAVWCCKGQLRTRTALYDRKCITDSPRRTNSVAAAAKPCGNVGCGCHHTTAGIFKCATDLRKERLRLRPRTAGSTHDSQEQQQLSPRARLRQWRGQQRQWSRCLSPRSRKAVAGNLPRRRSQAPATRGPPGRGLQHLLHDRASHRAKRSAELVEALVNLRREEEQMETTSLEMFHAWDTLVRATATSSQREHAFLVDQAQKLCAAREYMDRLLTKVEGLERENCRRFHAEQLLPRASAAHEFHSFFGSVQQGALTEFLSSQNRVADRHDEDLDDRRPLQALSAAVERPKVRGAASVTRPATTQDVARTSGNKAESFFLKRRLAVLQDQWEESQVGIHRLLKSIAVLEREFSMVK